MGSDDDHRRSTNHKIMIILFSSSLAFVLLLVLLHLYSRYLLRGQERSRRRVRFLYGITRRQTAPDVENSVEPQPPKPGGLDPLVMASLPTFTYNKQTDGGHEPVECSVCLAIIVEGAMVKVLPNCKHTFHVDCIDMWLGSHSTCPICRTAAEPRVQQPSAPPLEENMVSGSAAGFDKDGESSAGSRSASFRRMLATERSSRTRSCGDEVATGHLEQR